MKPWRILLAWMVRRLNSSNCVSSPALLKPRPLTFSEYRPRRPTISGRSQELGSIRSSASKKAPAFDRLEPRLGSGSHHPPPGSRDRQIVAEALGASTPEARQRHLAQACAGDENLRALIVSLLEAHEQAVPFLTGTVIEEQTAASIIEKPGDLIGRYKL